MARTLQILRQSRVTFVYPTNHVPKNREFDVTRGKVGLLARRQKVFVAPFLRTPGHFLPRARFSSCTADEPHPTRGLCPQTIEHTPYEEIGHF